MDILTPNEHARLKQLKKDFSEKVHIQIRTKKDDVTNQLFGQISCVESALDAFGSEIFVVSCIGMLKAGKSTLVNLFSRSEQASPTGFGVDTTLRPALITYTKETQGKIEIWMPNEPGKDLTKDVLNDVFLCLRNVKKPDEVKGATCKNYPLTPSNLNNALCKEVLTAEGNMLPCEPVMVVVKVPHCPESLLSSEIAILDTPGLDSGLSKWTDAKSERYQWIIENSDLLLFLQSSVAPLNQNATRILRDIKAKKPNTPVWLIQNEMIAKPWLSNERIHEENEKQRTQAGKMFDKIGKVFKQLFSNLGKADSGVFDKKLDKETQKKLWEESQFSSMEDDIRKDLKSNIGPIRRKNCIEAVKRDAKELSDNFVKFQKELNDDCKTRQERIDAWKRFKDQTGDFISEPRQQNFAIESEQEINLLTTSPFSRDKYIRILHDCYDLDFKETHYKYEDIEKIISVGKEKLLKAMENDIQNLSLDKFSLTLHGNGEHKTNIQKYLLERFRAFAMEIIRATEVDLDNNVTKENAQAWIESSVKKLSVPELPKGLNVYVEELDRINIKIEPISKEKLWENICAKASYMFHKLDTKEARRRFLEFYTPDTKTGKFVTLINSVESKIKENLFKWLNTTAFEALQDQFKKELNQTLDSQISEEQKILTEANEDRANIKNGIEACGKLFLNMENF